MYYFVGLPNMAICMYCLRDFFLMTAIINLSPPCPNIVIPDTIKLFHSISANFRQ